MSETTLRVKTQADIAALKEYKRELAELTRVIKEAGAATREANGSGGATPQPGGTGPAAPGYSPSSGSPLPSPTTGPGAAGSIPAPSPAPTAPPPGSGASMSAAPSGGWSGSSGSSGQQDWRERQVQQLLQLKNQGQAYLGHMGATAVGLGLGASITGFLLNSGQKYLELSKIITHVGARFREAESNVIGFGGAMGYTIGQTAGLVESLGSVRDTFGRGEFLRSTGFARTMGIDPSQALGTFGRLGTLRGHDPFTNREMAEVSGRALASGMGQGRFGEYLEGVRATGEAQFAATGHYDFRSSMAAMNIPGLAFGSGDPRAQGEAGQQLMGGLHSTMTGNPAMQTFLMRAMGYGSKSGPGYIDMRKRLEAGVYDPQNVLDMFKAFRARGMGKGAMFRALESVSGGNLKAWQIEGLVNGLGDEGNLKTLERDMGGDYAASYVSRFTGGGEADFVASGRSRISMGEGRALQMEGMQMKVGDTVAQVMVDMTDVMINLAKTGQNLLGIDFETLIKDLSGTIKDLSGKMERASRPGAYFREEILEAPAKMLTDQQAFDLDQGLRTRYAGPGWGLVQGMYHLTDNYGTAGGGGQSP